MYFEKDENGDSVLYIKATSPQSDKTTKTLKNNSRKSAELCDPDCPVCQGANDWSNIRNSDYLNSPDDLVNTLQCLHTKLHIISLENLVLKSEAEVLREKLNAKARAVEILRSSHTNPRYSTNELDSDLKKEVDNLKTEMALVKGTKIASEHALKARIRELSVANGNLTEQLNQVKATTKQFAKEDTYLVRKNEELKKGRKKPYFASVENLKLDWTRRTSQPHLNSMSPNNKSSVPITTEAAISPSANEATADQNERKINNDQSDQITLGGGGKFTSDSRLTSLSTPDSPLSQKFDEDEKELSAGINTLDYSDSDSSCSTQGSDVCQCATGKILLRRQLMACQNKLSELSDKVQNLSLTNEAHQIALESQYQLNRNVSLELASVVHFLSGNPNEAPNSPEWGPIKKRWFLSSRGKENITVEAKRQLAEQLNQVLMWFFINLKSAIIKLESLIGPLLKPDGINETFIVPKRRDVNMENDELDDFSASVESSLPRISQISIRRMQSSQAWSNNTVRRNQPPLSDVNKRNWNEQSRHPLARSMIDLSRASEDSSKPRRYHSPRYSVYENSMPMNKNTNAFNTNSILDKFRSLRRSFAPTPDPEPAKAKSIPEPKIPEFNYTVMSQMVVRLNELHELLTRKQLINDLEKKREGRK
ncbi:unnamed protein product [Calicophoron daubneyi]|uniref:Uncharacterized protein n=1 Tax=Calicophoron daubneyi TaxID=300641 RepID=A0AAV2TMU9_CALDB